MNHVALQFKIQGWVFTDFIVSVPLSCTVGSLERMLRNKFGSMRRLVLWRSRANVDANLIFDDADAKTSTTQTLDELGFREIAARNAKRARSTSPAATAPEHEGTSSSRNASSSSAAFPGVKIYVDFEPNEPALLLRRSNKVPPLDMRVSRRRSANATSPEAMQRVRAPWSPSAAAASGCVEKQGTPYDKFFAEVQPIIAREHPEWDRPTISKEVGRRWIVRERERRERDRLRAAGLLPPESENGTPQRQVGE